jgi:hypothetical protein
MYKVDWSLSNTDQGELGLLYVTANLGLEVLVQFRYRQPPVYAPVYDIDPPLPP